MTQKFTISLLFSVILSGVIYTVSEYGPIPEMGLLQVVVPFVFFFLYFYLGNKSKSTNGDVVSVINKYQEADNFRASFLIFLGKVNVILFALIVVFVLYRLITNNGRVFDDELGLLFFPFYLVFLEFLFFIFYSTWRIFAWIISYFFKKN